MPGYELLTSDKDKLQKYLCSSCKLLVRDAVQTPCGHYYCETCFNDLMQDKGMTCLEDNEVVQRSQVFKDHCVRREILSQRVKCLLTEKGCEWVGEVRHLEVHVEGCDFLEVSCIYPECKMKVKKHQFQSHLSRCKHKTEKCPHCSEDVPLVNMKEHHKNECKMFPVSCPSCYKEEIPRDVMPLHLNPMYGYCPTLEGPCQFSTIGCPFKQCLDRKDRRQHLEEETAHHLSLLREESLKMSQKIAELEQKLKETVEGQKTMSKMSSVALLELEEKMLESTLHDGQMVWKITNVARRINDAVSGRVSSIYSPAIYSSRHGYKVCARIYLNGDGMGKGNSLSLFFVVMRGEYDALLPWPFKKKVTMMLLDQDNVEHIVHAFRPDPSSSSFQRPRAEMNIASGFPMFCPLSELGKHAYVKDDTMFIKIIVDPMDM